MATASEIQAQIEAVHAEIDGRLERAIALREAANDEVKAIRAEKDAAPRLHVKRNTKKRSGADEFSGEKLSAKLDALAAGEQQSDSFLPGVGE